MPSFASVIAYEKAKWRREHLGEEPQPKAVKEVVEESKATEQGPNYEEMSRSDLYREAKAKGCELPWVGTSEDEFIAWLRDNA